VLQGRLGDCVKDIERLVMVVVAVMAAIGDLELGGVGEAHGHLLVVDKVEVGSVLILLAPLVLYLGAGHAVGIKQVVEVGDHQPMRVGSSGEEAGGRDRS